MIEIYNLTPTLFQEPLFPITSSSSTLNLSLVEYVFLSFHLLVPICDWSLSTNPNSGQFKTQNEVYFGAGVYHCDVGYFGARRWFYK